MIKSINQTIQFHQFMLNWTKSPIWIVSSPRKFKFSQFIKLIKLNHKDQFNNIPQEKPNDQFTKNWLKTPKTPIFIGSKLSPKCMKHENKWKRKGKKVLLALKDKNLWKDLRENNKNLALNPWSNEKREKSFWKFWKSVEHVKS